MTRGFYEMFAGGGMARAGFGPGWNCLFANDVCPAKAAAYRANWGGDGFRLADVAALTPADLPGRADAVWASFPCQDLSLAGAGAGMGRRTRSGAFWPFWALLRGLAAEGRGPAVVVLENVVGAITARRGRAFRAIAGAFAGAGYAFGALVIDARLFTPQSRPRLLALGFDPARARPDRLSTGPAARWHPPKLAAAVAALPDAARRRWIWLDPPTPPARDTTLADLVEARPTGVAWDDPAETARLVGLMSEANRAKLAAAAGAGAPAVGALYRRTRVENGRRVSRVEVRFDGLAGCLRTPAGGSSRQRLLFVDGPQWRSRLLSAREAARLMGLDDGFALPARYNAAYHLLGDGVAPPVVRHVVETLVVPALEAGAARRAA